MRNRWLLIVSIFILSTSAVYGQLSFELGATVPLGVGAITNSIDSSEDFTAVIPLAGFLPLPTASVLYQTKVGQFYLGGGIRAYSLILATLAYPYLQAGLSLGNLSIDLGLGGLLLGYVLVGGKSGLSPVNLMLPEISGWYSLGHRRLLRVGAGILGIIPANLDIQGLPIVAYGGFKIVL